jgi:superfamily II RNA helicase
MSAAGLPHAQPEGPATFRGLTLFPFQRRALDAIFAGKGVVVAAPTGAGKTLVADYAIDLALEQGRRVLYTSPVKALSNQKFRDFRAHYGEERVGLMTGDVTLQPDAPLLVLTTEIFRNTIFEDPKRLDGFEFVIFDEVHYLDDRERGTVWEEAILYAPPHIRVVALSATVPNVQELSDWIEAVRRTPVEVIVEERRPVPLTHKVWIPGRGPRALDEVRRYLIEVGRHDERDGGRGRGRFRGPRRGVRARLDALERASEELVTHVERHGLLPAIYFCFSRLDCERLDHANAHRDLLATEEREALLAAFDDLARRYEVAGAPSTGELRRLAARGVLFHHAGMLPIDKEIVERLFTTGQVRLLFATETFALGVNMPARTVCFHALTKFDGVGFGPLLAREYWQMAGRAGRQGIDVKGWVFSLFDEGRITYPELARLQSGEVEPVRSRFNLNYGTILNLWRRVGDRVPDAWERSFARWQRGHGKGVRAGEGAKLIEARIELLRRLAYLDERGLTTKGRLCSKVNGYEIAVTEAWHGGWLQRIDPVETAMLFAAMVYDPRPSDASDAPGRSLKGLAVPFLARMNEVAELEKDLGIRDVTRGPDFGVSGPVQLWAEGKRLEEVLGRTTLAAGDLVRLLRMTIQLLRQAFHALDAEDPARPALLEARARLDRDEVDAKRQLELG